MAKKTAPAENVGTADVLAHPLLIVFRDSLFRIVGGDPLDADSCVVVDYLRPVGIWAKVRLDEHDNAWAFLGADFAHAVSVLANGTLDAFSFPPVIRLVGELTHVQVELQGWAQLSAIAAHIASGSIKSLDVFLSEQNDVA